MKNLKLPSHCAIIECAELGDICGGGGFLSDAVSAAAKFVFPESKIAGESRSGYYPTFILVPEAIFLDYAALRFSNFLFRVAEFLNEMGL